jgi:hypothetical protein
VVNSQASGTVRVMIERGRKKVVAVAFDWPGWERCARSEDEAMRVLDAYRPRYAEVARIAGLGDAFDGAGPLDIVERLDGTSTTDFFGISVRSASAEQGAMSDADCERKVALLRAAWARFDEVGPRVSPEMRKGARGAGRDRDQIVRHTLFSEPQLSKKVGVATSFESMLDPAGLVAHRDAFCAAIREYNGRGAPARSWALQFMLRRSAYHVLDHAWEMEDKDLSAGA